MPEAHSSFGNVTGNMKPLGFPSGIKRAPIMLKSRQPYDRCRPPQQPRVLQSIAYIRVSVCANRNGGVDRRNPSRRRSIPSGVNAPLYALAAAVL